MKYLVDTHALLWMMFEPKKLSQKAQEFLADKSLHKFVSVASLWEISIKNRIGKLPLPMGISGMIFKVDAIGIVCTPVKWLAKIIILSVVAPVL